MASRKGSDAVPSSGKKWPTRQSGKANYRSMANLSRKPSSLNQRPSRQNSLQEENDVAMETKPRPTSKSWILSSSKKRYSYTTPSDPGAANEMAIVKKYVSDKELMKEMMTCCQSLLQGDSIPYNPYPEIAASMRQQAERFHMFNKTAKAIQSEISNRLQPMIIPHIYGVKGHSGAWGLEAIVQAVSPQALKQYDWLIEDLSPTKLPLEEDQQEYSGQILVAMVGPAVFTGTLYPEPTSVDVRFEYVIYGRKKQVAFQIFNTSISEDIGQMVLTECPHRVIGVTVPGSKPPDPPAGSLPREDGFWTLGEAREQWEAFWHAVKKSVTKKRLITLQCVYLLDKERNLYRAGTRQYVLHFVETVEGSNHEEFTSYAALPFLTLYEGIFLKKAHAETYVTTLKRQEIASTTSAAQQPGEPVRQSMSDSLVSIQEEAKDDGSNVIHADEVKGPIRERWQRQIANLSPVTDVFRLAHLALLLALSDSGPRNTDVKIELYRFLHSTASSWHTAMSLNVTMQWLLSNSNEIGEAFLNDRFTEYREKLLAVINPDLRARSSEFHAAYATLDNLTLLMTTPDVEVPRKNVLKTNGVLTGLQYLQDYCTALHHVMIDDTLSFFKQLNLKELVDSCAKTFCEDLEATSPAGAEKRKTKSVRKLTTSPPQPTVRINHGVESAEIQHQQMTVINISDVKSVSNWPRIMVTEAILMQYLIDVKLDLVWREYLLELLSGSHLTPNPYPRLVTVLRQAAVRMQLCFEAHISLSSKLLRPDQSKLVDRTKHVYSVTNVGAFGLSGCSLAGVDGKPGAFDRVLTLAKRLANKEKSARKGQFQISVSQAIGQYCSLYGSLVPYLNILHLYEHYYIRGLIGADQDAIQLYAKLVYEYVLALAATMVYVILGVYFEGIGLMSEADTKTDKATFISHLVDTARKKKDIYLKMYQPIGWRYLCIHKHFCLHYIFVDDTEDRHGRYGPSEPTTLYQLVFTSQEEATAHYMGSGALESGKPDHPTNTKVVNDYLNQQIQESLGDHRRTKAYELILTRGLINKGAKDVTAAWRFFHSIAFKLDYIQTINKDLRSLIKYALAFPGQLLKTPSSQSLASKGRNAKTKGTASDKQSPFTEEVLNKFIGVYCDKLTSILAVPCAFIPPSLVDFLQDKLKTVIDVDSQTQRRSLIISKKTVKTLVEVFQLLLPVQDWTSYDIHKAISNHGNGHITPQETA